MWYTPHGNIRTENIVRTAELQRNVGGAVCVRENALALDASSAGGDGMFSTRSREVGTKNVIIIIVCFKCGTLGCGIVHARV